MTQQTFPPTISGSAAGGNLTMSLNIGVEFSTRSTLGYEAISYSSTSTAFLTNFGGTTGDPPENVPETGQVENKNSFAFDETVTP